MDVKMETDEPSKGADSEKMETGSPKDKSPNKIMEERKYDWNETIEPHIKIAVIGERGCGKSSLILAAKNQIFPHRAERFVSKRYPLEVEVDGKKEKCMVAEIDDWNENAERREKFCSEGDAVILLCYRNISTMTQFDPWFEKLGKYTVPVILVKIKVNGKCGVSKDQKDAEQVKYSGSVECCPHEKERVQEVFQFAVKKARRRQT